ncbi:MAG TPA: LysR family transcriptional regulator, partial [Inquilinus sp.]
MQTLRGSLPSLNALAVFEASARRLSFSKAAEDLAITQSAVSHGIRQLEAS